MLRFRRCVSCNVLLLHLGKAHRNDSQRNSVFPRLFAFACTILISRWSLFPASKSVGSFATSRASMHRAAKKAKSSKKQRRGRLLVAYRSTRIDLKCLARKFIGKLITFRRLRFNCTSCEWAREMHRRRSNRTQPTALATGWPQAFRLWKSDTCLYRINASSRMRAKCKLSLTPNNLAERRRITWGLREQYYFSNNSLMHFDNENYLMIYMIFFSRIKYIISHVYLTRHLRVSYTNNKDIKIYSSL